MTFHSSITIVLILLSTSSSLLPLVTSFAVSNNNKSVIRSPMTTSSSTKTTTSPSSSELYMNNKKRSISKKKASGAGKGFASVLRDMRNDAFPYAGGVKPGIQSPQKVVVDESIMKPDYALDGKVSFEIMFVIPDTFVFVPGPVLLMFTCFESSIVNCITCLLST